jgi:hypothetical protein
MILGNRTKETSNQQKVKENIELFTGAYCIANQKS